jgi:hypothetical protein
VLDVHHSDQFADEEVAEVTPAYRLIVETWFSLV